MSRLSLMALLLCIAPAAAQSPAWKRHTIDSSSRGADGVRLADTNGDGLPDIATGWEEGGLVRVYLNPGPDHATGSWPAVTVGHVRSPEDAVLVDLDGDGALDVVSCCEGSTRTVYIHWAPPRAADYLDASSWTTQAIPATAGQQMWMYALPLDVDGRHGIDLVVGSKGSGATIGWLESPENAREMAAWTFHPLRPAGWIMSLEAHDMDGDGDLDILASDRKGSRRGVFWLENPGPAAAASGAAWREHRIGGEDREVMFLTRSAESARHEIFAATRGGGILRFQQMAGGLWDREEIALPPGSGTGKAVAVGDIDGDGSPDVVFTCENAAGNRSGIRWLAGPDWKAAGSVYEISGPVGVKFDRLELLDLDGDGDLDVLTCEEHDNLGVIWYENPNAIE